MWYPASATRLTWFLKEPGWHIFVKSSSTTPHQEDDKTLIGFLLDSWRIWSNPMHFKVPSFLHSFISVPERGWDEKFEKLNWKLCVNLKLENLYGQVWKYRSSCGVWLVWHFHQNSSKLSMLQPTVFSPFPSHPLSTSQIFLPLISAPTDFHDWG